MSYLIADRKGLRDVTDPLSIFPEIGSNAFDTHGVTEVHFTATPVPGVPRVHVVLTDDSPEGWANLDHAYTMYAPSTRRDDATKRGRFNRGEKCFLAYVHIGSISTMAGTLEFDGDTMTKRPRLKRKLGTCIDAEVIMDRETFAAAMEVVYRIIPPAGVKFFVNGEEMTRPEVAETITVRSLPSEIWNEERQRIIPTTRTGQVEVFPATGGFCWIYEMGIPVVEVEGDFHTNVLQKVPLNMNRDNVTPSFLRKLRGAVLDAMVTEVAPERMAAAWVVDSLPETTDDTFKKVLDVTLGENRVAFTPGEPEANTRAMAAGYTVVAANAITGENRQRAKDLNVLASSAAVFDTGKVKSGDVPPIPRNQWSQRMVDIADYSLQLARHLGVVCDDVVWYPKEVSIHGMWSDRTLSLNASVAHETLTELDALLIHEFGHARVSDHFSDAYFHVLCDLGARMRGWTGVV